MATWDEVRAHLRSALKARHDDETSASLAWHFPGCAAPEEQKVHLVQAAGMSLLVIVSVVGPEAIMPARDALLHNRGLAFGALAVHRDRLVLRHVMPLEALNWACLDKALELVAHEALRLRRCGERPAPIKPFDPFAD